MGGRWGHVEWGKRSGGGEVGKPGWEGWQRAVVEEGLGWSNTGVGKARRWEVGCRGLGACGGRGAGKEKARVGAMGVEHGSEKLWLAAGDCSG